MSSSPPPLFYCYFYVVIIILYIVLYKEQLNIMKYSFFGLIQYVLV